MSKNREFEGVWIPKELWLDKDLSVMEKILLKEIQSFESVNGCFASNKHFAQFLSITESRVSQLVSSLVKKKRITTELHYKSGSKQVDKRIIKSTDFYINQRIKYSNDPVKYTKTGIEKINKGYLENCEGNSTSNNNTSNNIKDIGQEDNYDYLSVLNYLNEKAGTNYRNVEGNKKHIRYRFNDGYKLEDFKKVIDNKCIDWLNSDHEKYLRCSTLFGPKFDEYLNANVKAKTIKGNGVITETVQPVFNDVDNIASDEDLELFKNSIKTLGK